MEPQRMTFTPPPRQETDSGDLRRVGFELEFAGLSPADAAEIVQDMFGGRVTNGGRWSWQVEGARFGEFKVEMDSTMMKQRSYEKYLATFGIELDGRDQDEVDEVIDSLLKQFVPCEITTPPIPLDRLAEVEELRRVLHEKKARGTGQSMFYAFALQFNPEAPSLETSSLLAHLRAFLLLVDWIRSRRATDLSRRISPFIDEFPGRYVRKVLDPDYEPCDRARFLDDYLRDNPTRDRPLDCLPILAMIDEDQVAGAIENPHLLEKRPAYHYRLPDCRLDDPAWTIADEWNYWVEVEKLAHDPERITVMSEAYLDKPVFPLDLFGKSWARQVAEWME
jgi:hypothetical protein